MESRSLVAAFVAFALLASPFAARARSEEDDVAEAQNYRLTIPVLKKCAQVQENIYAAVKANPSLTKYWDVEDRGGANDSIDQTAKKFESIPELKRAIAKAGLTAHEYLLATMAMVQASLAEAVAQTPGADLGKLAPAVRANLAFAKANQAELARMQKRSEELDREIEKLAGRRKSASREPTEEQPSDDDNP